MGSRSLDKPLESLDGKVAAMRAKATAYAAAIDRWRGDAAAALFHLRRKNQRPMILCILGGTGTGKSTLVNRLLEANLSSSSFRRTFTAGPVAVAAKSTDVPENWLGLPRTVASPADLPVRGQSDCLILIEAGHDLLGHVVLVDTPDLDGDQPVHHAQADRAFRWAEAIIFLVSPEKYQMTELLPYYRLAKRYAVPALFAMNKCETPEMLEDYRQLVSADQPDACVFAVARDDAAYEPPPQNNLSSLRQAIASLQPAEDSRRESGLSVRIADVLGRLRDQITGPLRAQRRDVDAAVAALRAMEAARPGVDVNPLTEQLQRRLQQRSVLYLMGPGRILDRVRQVPGILVRLPRTTWELFMHGRANLQTGPAEQSLSASGQLPDFHTMLVDQFAIVQSRIDDAVCQVGSGSRWLGDPSEPYAQSKIDPSEAGKIADEELKELNDWLQKRWNATPRDTVLLLKLLRHLPGGEKLTQWTEAAPYLLAIIVAAHHAIFGHVDLMILGGYSIATWITERLSNEVAARTRQANRAIDMRFEKLAREQIRRSIAWIESRAPRLAEIDAVESLANELQESL
jgi:RNase P/RNase MRP subunit POP5